jgi:glycine/D-amino acid oxidase-like deaminating enzyme
MTDNPKPLTDEDVQRASIEWVGVETSRRQMGARATLLAEAAWAAEWAERFLAEVRRLRIKLDEKR